jgi:hypothetical protein
LDVEELVSIDNLVAFNLGSAFLDPFSDERAPSFIRNPIFDGLAYDYAWRDSSLFGITPETFQGLIVYGK